MGNKLCCKAEPSVNNLVTDSDSCSKLPDASPKVSFFLPNGVSICWLDARAETESNDCRATKAMLRHLHPSVFIWTHAQDCLAALKANKNKHAKVFLVVSGELSTHILTKLDIHPVIDSVFVYCYRPRKYRYLINRYKPHLIDVFFEEAALESSLKMELDAFEQRQSGLNFFAQKQSATRDLTYDAASFLWFQLLQSMLVQGEYDDADKKFMLNHCRCYYVRHRERDKFHSQIDDFDRRYSPLEAIKWYTKDIFLYRLVNAALRTEDVEALWIFRFFLAHLARQLVVEHRQLQNEKRATPILTLYRGDRMVVEEVQKLADLRGGMTSFNGFLSTSFNRSVAEDFMKRPSRLPNPQKVLFTIQADTRLDRVVFASIGASSDFRTEEEVLFNLGSAFLIDEVKFDPVAAVWHVRMTATDMGDKAAADYINLIQQELMDSSVMVIFGQLLMAMGKYTTAHKYFLNLLERFRHRDADHSDLGDIHYHLGLTFAFQKELDEAESHLWQAYTHQKLIASKKRNVVRTQNALGWIHQDNGELVTAMNFYIEAQRIGEQMLGSQHLSNAQTCSNIGSCYLERGNFADARTYYDRALHILKAHLPSHHPRVGVILNSLGNVSRKETDSVRSRSNHSDASEPDDWLNTLALYQEAEQIFRSSLPAHHPYIAYCWSCMGFLYLRENKMVEAHHYHEKALQSYRRTLPADHVNIYISEQNLKCRSYQRINDNYLHFDAGT